MPPTQKNNMTTQRLSRRLLSLILYVQAYRNFAIQRTNYAQARNRRAKTTNWHAETINFYNGLPDRDLQALNLHKNINDFETILNFTVTEEMLHTKNLGKFVFVRTGQRNTPHTHHTPHTRILRGIPHRTPCMT